MLDVLTNDQKIITDSCSKRKRRTVLLKRTNNCQFGFTIQAIPTFPRLDFFLLSMLLTVQSFGFYKFIYLFILFFFLFFFEILLALITIAEIFSFLCFFKTYIVQRQDEAFKISYIDYVHLEGPAADAGLRPGNVASYWNTDLC